MPDNEIIERYFKARGWEFTDTIMPAYWRLPNRGIIPYGSEPNILESFPDFKEHVLEPMGEEGCIGLIEAMDCDPPRLFFVWDFGEGASNEEIKDNNILHAAVIAATRYFKNIKVIEPNQGIKINDSIR